MELFPNLFKCMPSEKEQKKAYTDATYDFELQCKKIGHKKCDNCKTISLNVKVRKEKESFEEGVFQESLGITRSIWKTPCPKTPLLFC